MDPCVWINNESNWVERLFHCRVTPCLSLQHCSTIWRHPKNYILPSSCEAERLECLVALEVETSFRCSSVFWKIWKCGNWHKSILQWINQSDGFMPIITLASLSRQSTPSWNYFLLGLRDIYLLMLDLYHIII